MTQGISTEQEADEDDRSVAFDSAQFLKVMSPPVCDYVGRAPSRYPLTHCLETDRPQLNHGAPCIAAIQAEERLRFTELWRAACKATPGRAPVPNVTI